MKIKLVIVLALGALVLSCNNKPENKPEIKPKEIAKEKFQNKAQKLVYEMTKKVGNYQTLLNKKDVVYTYTYQTPDGKSDISTEKYIFNGELSYGMYHQHERTFSDLKGPIEQGYNGKEFWLKHNGVVLKDSIRLKRVAFNRPTNFYWFTMFQKLMDPGLTYEYLGEKILNDIPYDIVKISFNSVNEKPTDIYQLYINKKTMLVDQFLFTVADFGVVEEPFLMTINYEKIEDMLIPTQRLYKKSTWNADVSNEPWIKVNWTNIKFNNGLVKDDFFQ